MRHLFVAVLAIAALAVSGNALALPFFSPSFSAVNGQISASDPKFDLSRLAVEVTIGCQTGWGDGAHECGSVSKKVAVNSQGKFGLPKLQGSDWHFFKLSYAVYLDGQPVFAQSGYRVQDDGEAVHQLLENMTLEIFEPYKVHFTTDTGADFATWEAQSNHAHPLMYLIHKHLNDGASSLTKVDRILREESVHVAISKNGDEIPQTYFLLAGSPQDVARNYSYDLTIEQCDLCALRGVEIYHAQVPVTGQIDPALKEIELKTKHVNTSFTGAWGFSPEISFDLPNGNYFSYADPIAIIQAECKESVLSGTITYDYSHGKVPLKQYNHTDALTGECHDGSAVFNASFVGVSYNSYDQTPESVVTMPFSVRVELSDIEGRTADVKVTDLATGKVYNLGQIMRQ